MKERIKRGLKDLFKVITRPEMKILPGQLAFSFVLSIVPTLTILMYVASILHVSMDFITDFITKAFSNDFAKMLFGNSLVVKADWKFFTTLITGYILASNGTSSIIVSSNTIYGIKDSSFLRRRIKAFVMVVLMVLLFFFLLIFGVFGNKILGLLKLVSTNKKILTNITLLINVLKGPVAWFIIFLFIKLIFTIAPDKNINSSEVNKGAFFTTLGFIVITYLYSIYTTYFARYDVFYGSLASIVVLMIWLYLLSYIFTIGLALNYRVEELEKTKELTIIKDY